MQHRRQLIQLACATALACAAGSAAAQGTVTLKAADVHPPGYPNVVAMENLGKKMEAATKGHIKMQMFPGGVLGSEKEMVEQTQVGAISIARTEPPSLAARALLESGLQPAALRRGALVS